MHKSGLLTPVYGAKAEAIGLYVIIFNPLYCKSDTLLSTINFTLAITNGSLWLGKYVRNNATCDGCAGMYE